LPQPSPLFLFVAIMCYCLFSIAIGVIAYVFCHAGVLVCLFVVNGADFWYVVIEKTGYRILNCIIISWSFIFVFYLSLGIRQVLLKVIFVAVIVSPAHSYLKFICVGCYFYRSSFLVWYNRICGRWAGVRRHN